MFCSPPNSPDGTRRRRRSFSTECAATTRDIRYRFTSQGFSAIVAAIHYRDNRSVRSLHLSNYANLNRLQQPQTYLLIFMRSVTRNSNAAANHWLRLLPRTAVSRINRFQLPLRRFTWLSRHSLGCPTSVEKPCFTALLFCNHYTANLPARATAPGQKYSVYHRLDPRLDLKNSQIVRPFFP